MVVILAMAAIVAPRSADAYVGEGLVVSGTDLTGPAKTILTNPTFLVEGSTEAATIGETATVARTASMAGLIPGFAAAVPWVVGGVAAGAIACELLIGGCLEIFSDSPGAAKTPTVTWALAKTTTTFSGATIPIGYYYTTSPHIWKPDVEASCGSGKGGGYLSYPSEAGSMIPLADSSINCPPVVALNTKSGLRSGWDQHGVKVASGPATSHTGDYCWIGKSTCASTANPEWSKRMAECLGAAHAACGMTESQRDKVGQWIASKIPASGVSDPYDLTVDIPNCDGLVYASCADLLEERELIPERVKRTWEDAEVDKDPDEVLELDPAKATEVEKGSVVVVTTNPDESGMPIVIPPVEDGETYDHYAARLNPSLSPERHDLEAAYVDPSVGPNGVSQVEPAPETRLDPSKGHEVRVDTNPPDAPVPAGPWSPPSVPAIDMGPMSGIPSPCTVFPFGLFCWIKEGFEQFNTTGACPHAAVPVSDDADFELTLCGDTSNQVMGYVRPAILLVFIVGCGIMFARGTKAVGGED